MVNILNNSKLEKETLTRVNNKENVVYNERNHDAFSNPVCNKISPYKRA